MYLIDTMVLSETFKRQPNPRAIAWLRRVPAADAFLSVLSIGDIERGIAREQRRDRRHFEHTGVEVLNPYETVTSSDA